MARSGRFMICLDTTFLVDLWRYQRHPGHPTKKVMEDHAGEVIAVSVTAAGEFLEGAACVSKERLNETLHFLRKFELGEISLETAKTYAVIVADLRKAGLLKGASKADLWIAAWAHQHRAPLATRNTRHFEHVPDLVLIRY